MKSNISRVAIALGIVTAISTGTVSSQQPPTKRDFEAEIGKALASAKAAAGFEFLGTLVRTCLVPQSGGENTSDVPAFYITDPAKAPPRSAWYTEPAKVFDNLYFVGGKIHSAWALTTKEGIILFDTIYPYNSEELIIDGMKITLGESTVTITHTPGHTPGTLSYTFTVLDRGKPVNVAYSGGTAFNFVNNTPDPGIRNFQIYIDSQRRFAANVAATGATVLMSNHSEFDIADTKNKMLAARGNGPHPYEQGADAVQRYFRVMHGCARAAQLRLEQKQAETAKP
jgi:hypothetical protein